LPAVLFSFEVLLPRYSVLLLVAVRCLILVGEDYCEPAASAVALSTLAESAALADLPPPIDQIGFLNRLHQRLAMPSSHSVKTHDKMPRAMHQIASGLVVALLFVIGGLVQIVGMLP
jgi:hypothetical protein